MVSAILLSKVKKSISSTCLLSVNQINHSDEEIDSQVKLDLYENAFVSSNTFCFSDLV